MPEEPRRIIIEKSSTVRRRYQRSNKRFKFTASQLRRIEREEELERRAKAIKEKEEKRKANKKKKAEKEARDREERKRLGLPDPNAPKIPASQPLLSAFLGAKPKKPVEEQPVTPKPDPTTTEIENDQGGDTEVDSAGGDTEAESDLFDDLDQDIIEEGFSRLQDEGISKESEIPDVPDIPEARDLGNAEILCPLKPDRDDDEFSDCSVFDDADIMKKADALAASLTSQSHASNPPPPPPPPTTTTTSSLAPPAPTMGPPRSPRPGEQSKSITTSITSLGDSFHDETADYLEDVFSRGCGDSFGELVQLGSGTR